MIMIMIMIMILLLIIMIIVQPDRHARRAVRDRRGLPKVSQEGPRRGRRYMNVYIYIYIYIHTYL